MNYEQLLQFLRQNGGSRSIDTPAEAFMRGITADAFGGGRDSSALDTAIKDSYYTTVRPEYRDSRELNTAVERAMRMGSLSGLYSPSMAYLMKLANDAYGSRGIDTPAESSLLRGALRGAFRGLYSPSMAYLMKLANDAYGSRGIDTPAELKMRMGSLGNQNSTQAILRSILGQE